MPSPEQEIAVHRSVIVPLPRDRAFSLFTERMGAFWPAGHSIGSAPLADVVVEPWVGGRWFERGVDGSECDWGRVAVWAPPERVTLLWQIGVDWTRHPELETEVEVVLQEVEPGTTHVDLTHRHLERYRESAARMANVFESPQGWTGIMLRFVDVATTGSVSDPAEAYRRAQDVFEVTLAAVPPPDVDGPTTCTEWTVRDVVAHTIWGQELVRYTALGEPFTSRDGAPGSTSPGHLAGDDPLATWRAARDATAAVLADGLDRPAPPGFVQHHPCARLADFLDVLTLDYLAHSWDVGDPRGIGVHLPPDILRRTLPVAATLDRSPGMLGPELTPPPDADDQTRWLAALGRRAPSGAS